MKLNKIQVQRKFEENKLRGLKEDIIIAYEEKTPS